ncbi:MAG: dienelactone hydrolase family protein [Pseudomonadota bacterium]
MKTTILPILLVSSLLLAQCQSGQSQSAASNGGDQPLVDQFWRANNVSEQERASAQLLAAGGTADVLYDSLKSGPSYSADVPTGQLEQTRTAADGTVFPYIVLVPDDYNPRRAYPVEFNLHGGVNRPPLMEGEPLWRQGYDALRAPDRIIVVPAAWDEAFWWFDNQADNVPAILRTIKQTYNVDDNQVYMTGVSDGGTGSYFFAFMQPTEWAAFLPYIGNPGVLQNPAGRASYPLSFDNLAGKALYIVNGENDPLYPARAVQRYIDYMARANVDHVFRVIPNGGHNTAWLPEERPAIEAFKRDHIRDPLPERVQWATNRTDRYNRNHWLVVDELDKEGEPGRVIVFREGNQIRVNAYYVNAFTLLLNPEEIDFSQPVTVILNDTIVHDGLVTESAETLLKWAARDRDRSMLFTAELTLRVPVSSQ